MGGEVGRQLAESAQCERDGCDSPGTTYYTWAWAGQISDAPIPFTGNALTPLPEQPIRLCHGHALDAFGVAFPPGSPTPAPEADQ